MFNLESPIHSDLTGKRDALNGTEFNWTMTYKYKFTYHLYKSYIYIYIYKCFILWKYQNLYLHKIRHEADIPFKYGSIIKTDEPYIYSETLFKMKNRTAAIFVSHCQ